MKSPGWVVVLLILMNESISSGQQDSRCFLEGGGSTESFFIKESLGVGSLIGTLRILGEIGTEIELKLDGEDSPIDIEGETKNLILTKPLDKEGKDGPSSVSLEIICERIGVSDPGFTIPVNIRVTDVNDNAPIFQNDPYKLNISELTIVGSSIYDQIKAFDRDQPGPFSTVEYSIANGKFSDYVAFANPLEGSLILTKHLDYETLKTFEVQIVARDQGSPPQESESTLTIHIQDADDQNPAFFYDHYDALLPQGSTEGQKLMVQPQDLRAFDKDLGLASPVYYSFNGLADEYKYFELNRNTGHIYIRSDIPETDITQPVTLVIKATQFDNLDRYAVTTLTISRGGIFDSDLQFLQKTYDVKILENVPLNSVVTTLLTNKPADRRVHFYIDEENTLPGKEFSVNQKGDVVLRKMLDYELKESYSFVVTVTDGRKNDTARVNVSLLNINDWDPRFKYPQYEFFVQEADMFRGFIIGKMEVHDGDKGDTVTLDIRGPYARAFRINRRGELIIDALKYLNSSEAHIVVVAEDSGIPPRRASVPVVIKFGGEISARIQDPFSAALDSSLILLIFGVICLILFVVILTMTIYICKHKKKYNRSRLGSAFSNGNDPVGTKILTNYSLHPSNYANGIRKPHSGVGVDNPVFHRSDYTMNGSRPGSASSRRSSSETLSSDPSGNQLQPSQNGHHHHHHHHQPQALNPLNPQSGSHRYSKNSVIRSATVANVGRGSGALSGSVTPLSTSVIVPPPPPTPSIHSNGLPEPKYTSASNSNNNISANPMPSGSTSSSAYHNGAIPRSVGSVNSVHSSTHSVRSSTIDFHGSDASLQQALRDNIFNSSNRDLTRIQWPRNSIPRRVKKLSWEDEYELSREHGQDRDISTLTDPNVSVTPLDPNLLEPQIGKALYF